MRTVLAVDGGNSKTDVALVPEDGTVQATGRGPALRPQTDGVGAAIDCPRSSLLNTFGPKEQSLLAAVDRYQSMKDYELLDPAQR